MFPLYNTCLLLLSGITVTWLHKAINLGFYKDAIDSFFLTIFLGLAFFILQMFEYYDHLLVFIIVYMVVHFLCLQVYMVFMYL
jgi:heme/copper-type cytochrome/quinol oxidase subunit 3